MSRCGSTGQQWQQGEGSRAIQWGTGWAESNDWAGRDSRQPAQKRQGVKAGNRAQAADATVTTQLDRTQHATGSRRSWSEHSRESNTRRSSQMAGSKARRTRR